MLENIIVGREPADTQKYGSKGCVFLGKHTVSAGFETNLTNPILVDVAEPHVMLIVGKRGSGKSYSAAVIAEEIMQMPTEIRNQLSVIMIDTAGIFWSMKEPNDQALLLLKKWNLEPKTFDTKNIIPLGLADFYKKNKIDFDDTFAIRPSDLTAGDWALTFGINLLEPLGVLLERIMKKLQGKDFTLDDIIHAIEKDDKSDSKEKQALANRFAAAETWGIFSKEATPIEKFLVPGIATVLDVSLQEWNVRNLMLGVLARKLYEARTGARREEEMAFMEGESKRKMPLVWLMMDECLPQDSEIITDKAHTKIGDIVSRFQSGDKFKVLGYDTSSNKYGYFDVTNVYDKGEREIIEISTETGRKLKCTPNHRILTSSNFVHSAFASDMAIPAVWHYDKKETSIKARIFGYILGDGWLQLNSPSVGFSGKGNTEDLNLIKKDLELLGFSSGSIRSRKTTSSIKTVDGSDVKVSGISSQFTASTHAYKLFSELGAPKGEKVKVSFQIPDWLSNASNQEKAEFLGALMGADGDLPKPVKKSPQSFYVPRLSFNKIMELEENALTYAEQLKKLFNDLGIPVKISKRKGNIRKDGFRTFKILITIFNGLDNLIKFLEVVGYRYCRRKEIEGNKILSYLKAKKFVIENRKQLQKEALRLHSQGLGKVKISKILNVPVYQARNWIYFKHSATSPHKLFPSYRNWIENRFKDGTIFEKIIDKKPAGRERVYDISVEKVHNFVANGAIVHNCHNFIPADAKTAATDSLLTLVRQGRQPGISTVFITQRPNRLHEDVIAQSDFVLAHRLTAKQDLDALGTVMQTYLLEDIRKLISEMPKTKGAGIILDDNSERLFAIQVRPRQSWHAGGTASALK